MRRDDYYAPAARMRMREPSILAIRAEFLRETGTLEKCAMLEFMAMQTAFRFRPDEGEAFEGDSAGEYPNWCWLMMKPWRILKWQPARAIFSRGDSSNTREVVEELRASGLVVRRDVVLLPDMFSGFSRFSAYQLPGFEYRITDKIKEVLGKFYIEDAFRHILNNYEPM